MINNINNNHNHNIDINNINTYYYFTLIVKRIYIQYEQHILQYI